MEIRSKMSSVRNQEEEDFLFLFLLFQTNNRFKEEAHRLLQWQGFSFSFSPFAHCPPSLLNQPTFRRKQVFEIYDRATWYLVIQMCADNSSATCYSSLASDHHTYFKLFWLIAGVGRDDFWQNPNIHHFNICNRHQLTSRRHGSEMWGDNKLRTLS